MKIKYYVVPLIVIISILFAFSSFAEGWKMDDSGWVYVNDDGSYVVGGWHWLDGNHDGIAECYYFDGTGHCLINTTTPDNYQVDANGAWIVDGVVQTKSAYTENNIAVDGAISVDMGEDVVLRYIPQISNQSGTIEIIDVSKIINDKWEGKCFDITYKGIQLNQKANGEYYSITLIRPYFYDLYGNVIYNSNRYGFISFHDNELNTTQTKRLQLPGDDVALIEFKDR